MAGLFCVSAGFFLRIKNGISCYGSFGILKWVILFLAWKFYYLLLISLSQLFILAVCFIILTQSQLLHVEDTFLWQKCILPF